MRYWYPLSTWYRSPALLICAWVVAVVVMGIWAAATYHHQPVDFVDLSIYRLGVRTWWHGGDLYGKLPAASTGGHLPYVYPPVSVLLLGPLAMLSWGHAIIATFIVSMAAMGVVLYLSFRRIFPGSGRRGALLATAVLLPASLLLEPVAGNLEFGQVNTVLMALAVVDCLAVRSPLPRGVLIGIAAAVKLTPAVFLLYFLVRKDFRAAIWMTATAAACTVFGFVVSWSGSVQYWFGSSGGARTIGASAYYSNQTLDALLSRWALPSSVQTGLWLLGCAVLTCVAAIAIRRAGRMGDTVLAVVITGVLGLVVSPTSWGYHWVYVAPAVLVLASYGWRRRDALAGWGWGALCLAVALVFWDAPFLTLPHGSNREQQWTLWQQLPGNAYLLTGVALLVGFAAPDLPGVLRAVRTRLSVQRVPVG